MGKRDGRPLIMCVVGARPNYMKMAPILDALKDDQFGLSAKLVHTGQHYDVEMNAKLFTDLGLPAPDVNLEVGSGSHAVQTAEIMKRFEPLLLREQPSCVLVVGDVNSTLACALVAAKLHVPVVHVEAGLRSGDRRMPEEINRVLTDQISDLLFTTERTATANLQREGVELSRVHFVGNAMIDSLLKHRLRAPEVGEVLGRLGVDFLRLPGKKYGLCTLHRPTNVDTREALEECLDALAAVAELLPLVCAFHPRTRQNIERFGLAGRLDRDRMHVVPPVGYLEMLSLMSHAAVVLTDSGGMQEETTALGVPCLTMRENTERPITVDQGTNELVGREVAKIMSHVSLLLAGGGKRGRVPEYWDGRAASRIAFALAASQIRRSWR